MSLLLNIVPVFETQNPYNSEADFKKNRSPDEESVKLWTYVVKTHTKKFRCRAILISACEACDMRNPRWLPSNTLVFIEYLPKSASLSNVMYCWFF